MKAIGDSLDERRGTEGVPSISPRVGYIGADIPEVRGAPTSPITLTSPLTSLTSLSSSLSVNGAVVGSGLGLVGAGDVSQAAVLFDEEAASYEVVYSDDSRRPGGDEDDDNFHSRHNEVQASIKAMRKAEAIREGWDYVTWHEEIHGAAIPSSLACAQAFLKMAREVHNKPAFEDLRWDLRTSDLTMHKQLALAPCRSTDLKAVAFFSLEDKKVTIAFAEQEAVGWWDWFWGTTPAIPIDTIKALAKEVVQTSKGMFRVQDIHYETIGFAKGGIIADIFLTELINNGIYGISSTFENPGSWLEIQKLRSQGHFSNLTKLPDDFSEWFNPFMSTTLVGRTLDKQCAHTIEAIDVIFDVLPKGRELTIEEFFIATKDKPIRHIDGLDLEENDDIPPLVPLSLLLGDTEIQALGEQETDQWYNVPLDTPSS